MTGRTLSRGLHLSKESASDLAHDTRSTAGLAVFDSAVLCTASFTGGAGLALLDFDGLFHARLYFFEGEAELDAKVASLLALGALSTTAIAKERFEGTIAEHISKLAEDVIHVHALCAVISLLPLHAGVTKAVVFGALVRVAEDFVGFGGFLKFIFCCLVVRILIRMILHRYLPIGFLYRGLICILGDFEYFVVIAFAHVLFLVAHHDLRMANDLVI